MVEQFDIVNEHVMYEGLYEGMFVTLRYFCLIRPHCKITCERRIERYKSRDKKDMPWRNCQYRIVRYDDLI